MPDKTEAKEEAKAQCTGTRKTEGDTLYEVDFDDGSVFYVDVKLVPDDANWKQIADIALKLGKKREQK